MKIFGIIIVPKTLCGFYRTKNSEQKTSMVSQPKEDIFVKTAEISDKEDNTRRLYKDVIFQNINPQTAIINGFEAEDYPRGIVDKKGNISVKNAELRKMFSVLAEVIPNYASIYGRKQHDTHKYTLDVHTFKVLKECVNNPKYGKLSAEEKTILQMTVLLHDIAKPPEINDRNHPAKSAIMAEQILTNFDFSEDTNKRIVNLVKNHGWYENYSKGRINERDVLNLPLKKTDFSIMAIISEADIKSVNDWFYDEYCSNLPNDIKEISKYI